MHGITASITACGSLYIISKPTVSLILLEYPQRHNVHIYTVPASSLMVIEASQSVICGQDPVRIVSPLLASTCTFRRWSGVAESMLVCHPLSGRLPDTYFGGGLCAQFTNNNHHYTLNT